MEMIKLKVPKLRFPELQDNLESFKMSSLGEFAGGGTPDTAKKNYWKGNIPWISSSDIEEDNITKIKIYRFINKEAIKESATKVIPSNSILFVSRVGVGKLVVTKTEICTSQDFTNFISKKVDSHYLGYYFLSNNNLLKRYSQGTSIKGLTTGDIKSIKVTIPRLQEQQKIASFLSSVDKKLEQLQKKKELLEQYKKGMMQKIFKQEIRFKDANGKDYPTWRKGAISDFGYFYYGKSAPKFSISLDAPTPCVRYGELYSTYNEVINDIKSYTNIDKKNLRFSKGGEVLVPRVGEDPLDFANCSYLPLPDVAIGEMISVYNTKENGLFITFYFNAMMRKSFAKMVEGGNVSNLYYKYLEDIEMEIPCIEEQTKIANFLSAIDDKIDLVAIEIEKVSQFKKGLLQQMFV